MTLDLAGNIIGVIGAIWLKISINLLNKDREKTEIEKLLHQQENPAIEAFIRGLSLIVIGLGMETLARLFLD